MFHKPLLLLRHIELRHPQSARQFSKSSNQTQDKTSCSVNQRNSLQEKSKVDVDSLVLGTNGSVNDQRLLFTKEKDACRTQDIKRTSSKKDDVIDFQDSEALPKSLEKQAEVDFFENGQIGECSKENSNQLHINPQNEKIHEEENSFACKICNRKFNKSAALKSHEKVHKEEKPFSCKYCNKKFARSGDRNRHEKIHTGEKPHACEYCDKRFIESGKLKIHERIHLNKKPYTCKYCNKEFNQLGDFKNHEGSHTDEKFFACKYTQYPIIRNGSIRND